MFDSELRRLADAGSAEHQWKLSLAYQQSKRPARASRYFRKALEQGYPEAIIHQLQQWTSVPGEFANFTRAQQLLDRYPAMEELVPWRWRLGVIAGSLSTEQEIEAAREQLSRGNPCALRYLALRCAFAGLDVAARALLERAAAGGDLWSRRILDDDAVESLPPLRSAKGLTTSGVADGWEAAFADSDRGQREELHANPRLYLSRGWLPVLGCRLLATVAEAELRPSLTYDARSGRQINSAFRTSHSMTFMPWLVDPSIAYIQRRLAAFCGRAPRQCEVLGLLRYGPGQEYKLHYDAFALDQPGVDELMRDGGQRTRTALIYLNAGYVGGETRMENLDLEIAGAVGDLLVFDNVDERGQRHPDSLHAGKPVLQGSKWLASQWFREDQTEFTRQMGW